MLGVGFIRTVNGLACQRLPRLGVPVRVLGMVSQARACTGVGALACDLGKGHAVRFGNGKAQPSRGFGYRVSSEV